MNASDIQKILIDIGYKIVKSHDQQTEKNLWTINDDDGLPIVSGHFLGEVLIKAGYAVGELK